MDVALGIVTFALLIICLSSSVNEILERRLIRYAASFKPERVKCRHENRVPVALTLTGEVVADLCLDCDLELFHAPTS